jgi:hypothetical protein
MQDNSLDYLACSRIAEALTCSGRRNIQRASPHEDFPATFAIVVGSRLRSLNLRHNSLGSPGAAVLVRGLRGNTSLQYLNLAWNGLAGEASEALADFFSSDTVGASPLQELDLRDNILGVGALIGFSFRNIAKRVMIVEESEDGWMSARAPYGRGQSHSKLSSAKNHKAGSKLVPFSLGVDRDGNPIQWAGNIQLQNLRDADGNYTHVHVDSPSKKGFVEFNEDACSTVPMSSTISSSSRRQGSQPPGWTSSRQLIDDSSQVSAAIPQHPALEILNLANNRLDDQGAGLLASAMPTFTSLKVLLLYNNADIGQQSELADRTCRSSVGKKQSIHPEKMGLHSLPMAMVARHGPATAVSAADPDGLLALVRALPQTLVRLSLGSCNLGERISAEVCRLLAGRPAFRELDLSDNDIKGQKSFVDCATHLLRTSAELRSLCLGLNSIGDEAVMAISRIMSNVDHPAVVNLSANKISDELRDVIAGNWQLDEATEGSQERDGSNTHGALARELAAAPYPISGRLEF